MVINQGDIFWIDLEELKSQSPALRARIEQIVRRVFEEV